MDHQASILLPIDTDASLVTNTTWKRTVRTCAIGVLGSQWPLRVAINVLRTFGGLVRYLAQS